LYDHETVDVGGELGEFTSLELDAAGQPHISYADAPNHIIKYAYRSAGAWHIETVDTGLGSSSGYNSLALDADGQPHISY
jgi:hypothetical protein